MVYNISMPDFKHNSRQFSNLINLFLLLSPILTIVIFTVLGLIQPGYDHLRYTVSRLAIGEYGWIQNLNFLQLAATMLLISNRLARITPHIKAKQAFRTAFGVTAAALVLAAVFPTDPSETRFVLDKFTPNGVLHIGVVIGFLILSPRIFNNLTSAFSATSGFEHLSQITLIMGYVALFASIGWLAYYPFGLTTGYLGIFQKAIIVWVLGWVEIIVFNLIKHK